MENFITDPPSTGLNDFNEESEMSNKQTHESTNKALIEMSTSSAPPAELRTTKALPQLNDSNEFAEDDRILFPSIFR
uniref:Uncharacterized protein n=1 Tax=Meloidogyne enterolobii TaxID=390850 RepID=A0A6V7W6E0_MELEN|nr:unnamed protein product [Meloidogyne enterolobii]